MFGRRRQPDDRSVLRAAVLRCRDLMAQNKQEIEANRRVIRELAAQLDQFEAARAQLVADSCRQAEQALGLGIITKREYQTVLRAAR